MAGAETVEADRDPRNQDRPSSGGSLATLLGEILVGGVAHQSQHSGPIVQLGDLRGVDPEGRILFLPDGAEGGPFPVTIGCDVSDPSLARAAQERRRALAVRASGATEEWVLVGLIRDRIAPAAVEDRDTRVVIDGETVRFGAEREIELRCGQSSLVLRSDGRVVLKGAYVVSVSSGPNKVRGAVVTLN